MTRELTDAQRALVNLAASATLADHMGDMWNYILEALRQVGIEPPPFDGDFDAEFASWLAKSYDAKTVYGTSIGEA